MISLGIIDQKKEYQTRKLIASLKQKVRNTHLYCETIFKKIKLDFFVQNNDQVMKKNYKQLSNSSRSFHKTCKLNIENICNTFDSFPTQRIILFNSKVEGLAVAAELNLPYNGWWTDKSSPMSLKYLFRLRSKNITN